MPNGSFSRQLPVNNRPSLSHFSIILIAVEDVGFCRNPTFTAVLANDCFVPLFATPPDDRHEPFNAYLSH